MDDKTKGIIGLIVCIILVLSLLGTCSSSDDGDGGNCRICGTHTNWTYRGGGYLCYSCDKKLEKYGIN